MILPWAPPSSSSRPSPWVGRGKPGKLKAGASTPATTAATATATAATASTATTATTTAAPTTATATAIALELADKRIGTDIAQRCLHRIGLATWRTTALATTAAFTTKTTRLLHKALVIGLLERIRDRAIL